MDEQSPRLTTGASPVYQWNEKHSVFVAADQWTEVLLFLETLFMQGMSKKIEDTRLRPFQKHFLHEKVCERKKVSAGFSSQELSTYVFPAKTCEHTVD